MLSYTLVFFFPFSFSLRPWAITHWDSWEEQKRLLGGGQLRKKDRAMHEKRRMRLNPNCLSLIPTVCSLKQEHCMCLICASKHVCSVKGSAREVGHSSMTQHHLFTGENNACVTAGMDMLSEHFWKTVQSSCSSLMPRYEIAFMYWIEEQWQQVHKVRVFVYEVCVYVILLSLQHSLSSQVDPFKTQWRITLSSGHWLQLAQKNKTLILPWHTACLCLGRVCFHILCKQYKLKHTTARLSLCVYVYLCVQEAQACHREGRLAG